jgi:hypothetical protein
MEPMPVGGDHPTRGRPTASAPASSDELIHDTGHDDEKNDDRCCRHGP